MKGGPVHREERGQRAGPAVRLGSPRADVVSRDGGHVPPRARRSRSGPAGSAWFDPNCRLALLVMSSPPTDASTELEELLGLLRGGIEQPLVDRGVSPGDRDVVALPAQRRDEDRLAAVPELEREAGEV